MLVLVPRCPGKQDLQMAEKLGNQNVVDCVRGVRQGMDLQRAEQWLWLMVPKKLLGGLLVLKFIKRHLILGTKTSFEVLNQKNFIQELKCTKENQGIWCPCTNFTLQFFRTSAEVAVSHGSRTCENNS